MSSIRFTSFGAATVPLSKIIVDKDLDLRPHGVIARYCRAPVEPTVWATETLDLGGGDPVPLVDEYMPLPGRTWKTVKTFETPPGESYKWRFIITTEGTGTTGFRIVADGVEVDAYSGHLPGTVTRDVLIPGGASVEVKAHNDSQHSLGIMPSSNYQNLGIGLDPKTFDLTGKWLALGIDMKGLAATIKIQGVEMPYSDYAKYFPIAPTELTIPGNWDAAQERPVIEVYK